LDELGGTRVVQLKEVTGVGFEGLKKACRRAIDYKDLYEKYHEIYQQLVDKGYAGYPSVDASTVELKKFIEDPEGTVDNLLTELNEFKDRLIEATAEQEAARRDREERLLEMRARLERVRALQPEEFKRCLAVGIVDLQLVPQLAEHLKRFDDLSHKLIEISPDTGYVFIFGPENRREWIETLFIVFDVKDVYTVLNTGDILLALDPEMREKVINEYEREAQKLQQLAERDEEEEVLKDQIEKIREVVKIEGKEEFGTFLGKARFYDYVLRIMANETIPVMRTRVLSIIQGWIADDKLPILERVRVNLEEKTGELLFVQIEEPSHDDHTIPTPPPEFKPAFLQPAWTLTSLRGWPNIHEFNPAYLSILLFSFQFGVMFGDVGQGAIFLLLGIIFTMRFKKGMASKIGVMFIPMGIASIVFGFLYGEVFLLGGIIHPILFSPLHHIGSLMKTVLGVAVIEMSLAHVIAAYNHIKEGDVVGVFGQHGLGSILFLVGLYLGGLAFLGGLTISELFSHWTFYMMIVGLILAGIVPLISAIVTKNISIDVMGEMISAFMMTFVESLASFFSFLRMAAFALAHASLALAAEALAHSMGPIIGLLLTNAIAMSFEFMSSSVQSLRLLYYEIMSRFFHGGGTPFYPFRIPGTKKS